MKFKYVFQNSQQAGKTSQPRRDNGRVRLNRRSRLMLMRFHYYAIHAQCVHLVYICHTRIRKCWRIYY